MDLKAALSAANFATAQSRSNSTRPSPAPTPPRPPVPRKPRQTEQYRDQSSKLLSPHITGPTLSNAVAGARLAVSRNPTPSPSSSPSRAALLPPPRPRSSASRGVSPSKPPSNLRETLRGPESSSSSEDEHRWRHPNKHNEGGRKRWRNRVTEEEYKRYAGWWAANRGLYITYPAGMPPLDKWAVVDPQSDPADEVLNLVVRELWRRSRLPDGVLREIWDLVDERGIGRLTKSQFVVGVWLIDQKLKGSKLPYKVAPSVWESVDRFGGLGVKIRVP